MLDPGGVLDEVEIEHGDQTKPKSIFWRDAQRSVEEIIDSWTLKTLWWEGEVERTYIQVMTVDYSIYTLFKCHESKRWFMDAVLA